MNTDLLKIIGVLAAVVLLFALGRPRMDVVALLALLALPLLGVISPTEALVGFSDQNVILIALLFVVGEGLVRTGVAQRLGDGLVRTAGTSESRLIALLMSAVAAVGSVMSSTGVVALFIPVALRIAQRTGVSPGRLLMPLSVGALLSGMMTLVATPPNLVVQGELERAGHAGFHFFSFTPFGIPLLGIAIAWMLFARRWLGAAKPSASTRSAGRPRLAQWVREYALAGRLLRLRVMPGSPLTGRGLQELDLRTEAGLRVLAIERADRPLDTPSATSVVEANDVLVVLIAPENFAAEAVAQRFGIKSLPLPEDHLATLAQHLGMAEVVIPAHSRLVGRTITESRFRSTLDLEVLGLKHGKQPRAESVLSEPLHAGDTLLVAGPWRAIRRLQAPSDDLVLLNLPEEHDANPPAASRAPYALGAVAAMVALMMSGVVSNVQAALLTCLLLGATGCVSLASAYRSIHWPTLVLIVGMIPFAQALQRAGGVEIAARALTDLVGGAGPRASLAALFVLTAVMGLFMSNTATAILMAPVALQMASNQGLSPLPFAMTIALAASAAFMTPVSSPVNTLVVGPGNYRFFDFVRVGVPLAIFTLLVTVTLVPVLLPF